MNVLELPPKAMAGNKGLFQNVLSGVLLWPQKNIYGALFKDFLCRRYGLQHVLQVGNGQTMSYYIFLQQRSHIIALLQRFQDVDWGKNILYCADMYFTSHSFRKPCKRIIPDPEYTPISRCNVQNNIYSIQNYRMFLCVLLSELRFYSINKKYFMGPKLPGNIN